MSVGAAHTPAARPTQLAGSVIEIADSDEDEEMLEADDKENEPVQARSVRRRVDRDEVEILGPPVPSSQRTGRPARTQNPVDVITLSDSD